MTARITNDLSPSSMTAHVPPARATNGATKLAPPVDLTGQGTVLLVEDDESVRSLIARGLRSRGYGVIEASNGLEALKALEQKNGAIDLVVSDVVMPEMDGPTKILFISRYAEDAFEKSRPENQLVRAVKETMPPCHHGGIYALRCP